MVILPMLATQEHGKEFFPVEVTLYLLNTEAEAPIPTILLVVVMTSLQEPWILYAAVKFHIH